jgi:dTMP kinase
VSEAPFFVFEGVDGVGKTTQQALFCEWLEANGREVVRCRDPGGTGAGEQIRGILLERRELAIDRRCEMLLYMAARAQLVQEVIRPALAAGKVVVCDRFVMSNIVYQGHAGGLSVEEVRRVGEIATGGLSPSRTLLLDMPAKRAFARIGREPDRMEAQGLAYLENVVAGYREEAKRDRAMRIIDADRSVDEVQAAIREAALAVA